MNYFVILREANLLYSKAEQLIIKSNRATSSATVVYSIANNTLHKSQLQKHNIRTDLKPLKRTGRCKVFLDFDRRAAVTFGPPTRTVEGKLLSTLMRRVPKAPHKENQTNQQRNASEAERKVRAQFTKYGRVDLALKEKAKKATRQSNHNQQRRASINSSKVRQEIPRFSGRQGLATKKLKIQIDPTN